MMNKMRINKGITLVSLVITIIVMLILAGVSLSMVTGDSSVLKNAQKTAFLQEISAYKEELNSEILGQSAEYYAKNLKHLDRKEITAAGEAMRQYIPSMLDKDLTEYMIVDGEVYYIGEDEFILSVCEEQAINTRPGYMNQDEFIASVEGRAMNSIIKKMAGLPITTTDEDGKIINAGVQLAKKHGFGAAETDWKVITEISNGLTVATYADGWYLVYKDTEVPGLGKLKYDYIINYDTRKAVRFNEDIHAILTKDGDLTVAEGLVYNADPSNMNSGSAESWGNAVVSGFEGTEYNGDGSVKSGWTKTAFVFDGQDDYIQIAQPGDFSKGFTFEFYGNPTRFEYSSNGNNCGGMFARVGEGSYLNSMRFGWLYSAVNVKLSSGTEHDIKRDKAGITLGNDFYLTYVLEINGTTAKGKFYINGVLKETDNLNYSSFVEGCNEWNKDNAPFEIGRTHWYSKNNWYYYQGQCYAARVFNRSLSADEVLTNYNATVAYHNLLIKDGVADNENTGGEDF